MNVMPPNAMPTARHATIRVRHELKRRTLSVAGVERLTPAMVRVTLAGDSLADFASPAFDDHVKLFFAVAGPDGAPAAEMRDYTPRRFDTARGLLVVDFALHQAGPATDWAARAAPGQTLEVAGPRGSSVIPDDFDWYLLVGDETALPAIARRVEELRPGVPVTTLVAVTGPAEEQAFAPRAGLDARWLHRPAAAADDPAPVLAALAGIPLPPGEGHVFIAAEAGVARALRRHIVEERGHPREWTKAAGYWKRGQADASEKAMED